MTGSQPHAGYDSVQGSPVLVEKGAALIGDFKQLARAVRCRGADLLQLLQQGEGGVDRTGTRGLGAAEFLLDLFYELVAVTGFLGDEGQQHQAQVAGPEDPAAATATPEAAASTGPLDV
jgi:hypothetical protein